MTNLNAAVNKIRTRQDLAEFVRLLRADLQTDPSSWENGSLDRFLDAAASWIEDMHGWYKNQGLEFSEDQPWRLIAQILIAAKHYE